MTLGTLNMHLLSSFWFISLFKVFTFYLVTKMLRLRNETAIISFFLFDFGTFRPLHQVKDFEPQLHLSDWSVSVFCFFLADAGGTAWPGFILRHGGRSGGTGHGDSVPKTSGAERHWPGLGWAAQHLWGLRHRKTWDDEETIARLYLPFMTDQTSCKSCSGWMNVTQCCI